MKFYSRAVRYVLKKKVKTLILLLIMTVASSMVIGSVCLLHSVKEQQAEIREKSSAKLSLSAGEGHEPITSELLEAASNLDNTAWINRLSTLSAQPGDFIPAPGADYPDNDYVTLHGFDDSSQDSPFAAQLLRLVFGGHISMDSRNMVILHRSMAEANGLEVGDTIGFFSTNGDTVKATICGIYEPVDGGVRGGAVDTAFLADNQIYGDNQLLSELNSTENWTEAFLYIKKPELLSQTKAELESLAKGLAVSEQNALFKRIQLSLEQTEKTVKLILALTIGTAAISITLLLCMWMRSRIKEFAVFMSMGENLFLIIAQVLLEVFILYAVAFILSSAIGLVGIRIVTSPSSSTTSTISEIMKVGIAGIALLAFAVSISLIPLMQMAPKDILSKSD